MTRLSVIVPVLNEERVLGQRIAELEALGVGEIIVADGGSSDGTRAVASAHPNVRLVSAPRGRATQMNAGAALATGDVLLFLHADVALPGDAVSQIERALADPTVVGGALRTWTVADRPTRLGPLLHCDPAARARAFRELGGFPPIPLMEDLALSRLLGKAGRVRVVPARVRVSGRRFIERPVFYEAVR